MQEALQGLLSAMGSWNHEFPQVVSIPDGKGHAATSRILRRPKTGRDPNRVALPCEMGSIERIPVRHDYFAKQQPTIVPIGGYTPDCHPTSVGALCGRKLYQQSAKRLGQKKGVDVHASSPHIRDCHIVLEKISRKKLSKAVQQHMLESDEGSSSELSCDSDYLPLRVQDDSHSSDGQEDDGVPPLFKKEPLQTTRDGSFNRQPSAGKYTPAQMSGLTMASSTVNESKIFGEDNSTQLSKSSCMDGRLPHDQWSPPCAVGSPSSPTTTIVSGPGEYGRISDNISMPESTAFDSDVPLDSPSLLDISSDSVNGTTATNKEACAEDRCSAMKSAASDALIQAPMANDSQSSVPVNEDIADMEMTTDVADTGKDEAKEDTTDITDKDGMSNLDANEGITDIACSEDSPVASSGDDSTLFSEHGDRSETPLTLSLTHSTHAVSGCSPLVSTDVWEDDATQLSSYWQSSPIDPSTNPLQNLRNYTQSSPELPENQMDASGDVLGDRHYRLLVLSSKSEADGDTLLSASPVCTPGSTVSTPAGSTMEHPFTQPDKGMEDDLDASRSSSMSAPPGSGRRKSMKLLKRRRLLSEPLLSPFASTLSSSVGKSKHEPPLTPKAKRPRVESEEDVLQDEHAMQVHNQLSTECKESEEAMDRDELPCFSRETSIRQEETEEGSGSAPVVPSSPVVGNPASQMDGNEGTRSESNAKKDEPGASSTSGQTPATRLSECFHW